MGHISSAATKSRNETVQEPSRNSTSPEKSSSLPRKNNDPSKSLRRCSNGEIILLESPDLKLDSHSRFNISSLRTYIECSGPWQFLISNRRQDTNKYS